MKICPTCNRIYGFGSAVCPRDGGLLNDLREWRAGDSVSEKFRIVEKIGHGSLGPSFRAKLLPFGGIRVLKCLSVRLADDEDLINRFQQVIKIASALKHLNAVHVESLEHSPDGHPYIVMEYAPGLSLRELLTRGGYIPALDVVDMMGQVCAALDSAHWQGIIHRNLKPDNVIVAEEHDGAPRVKVMEFGMAKLRQAAAESGKQVGDVVITDQRAVVGTMEYMSPEQAAGAPADKLDGRSDLYSVGVMMFEALTGELPISADDPKGLLFQHQGKAANEQLCGTVLKALQRDPECRYQTATEMIAALRAVSASLGKPSPVSVKSATAAGPLRVSSSPPAPVQTLEAGESRAARATGQESPLPAVPRVPAHSHTSPAMLTPRVPADTTDQSFDEMRRAWQQATGRPPVRRQARSRIVRTGLLFVCCALGVLLAARVIYVNRMLFMPPQIEGPSAERTAASPEVPAPDAVSDPGSLENHSPLIDASPDGQLSTVGEQEPYPPLPGVSNDANARPAQHAAGAPTRDVKAPKATDATLDDRRSPTWTNSTERIPSDAREAEIKKRIAIGWLLMERRDPQAATESFSEALKLDPSNVEAQAALRVARFATQNPNVDVLPSESPADGNGSKKGQP